MFDVGAFVIGGHEKVIDHYRRLRDSSTSTLECDEFQRRMDDVGKKLQAILNERLRRCLGSDALPLTQRPFASSKRVDAVKDGQTIGAGCLATGAPWRPPAGGASRAPDRGVGQ